METEEMEYVKKLLEETDYLRQIKDLEELERERRFCRHGLDHCLDVARIAWIQVLEGRTEYHWEKEQIYLTALLHDLGRSAEYEAQVPHHEAGRETAEKLLRDIGYPTEKQAEILNAIGAHRGNKKINHDFIMLIKSADNSSRNCFHCAVSKSCKWDRERKNTGIRQ